MEIRKPSGDDSEWSLGKDFFQHLATKFEAAELLCLEKNYPKYYDVLMQINPDVEMFMNDTEFNNNKDKLSKTSTAISNIKKKLRQRSLMEQMGVMSDNMLSLSPLKLNAKDVDCLYDWYCFLKRTAKNHGLITKLDKDWRAKTRREHDE